MEGLYITDLCKNKIAVDPKVVEEMLELRMQRSLQLCFTPIYRLNLSDFKICHLNARSLHKHINIDGFQLFRNDDLMSNQNNR